MKKPLFLFACLLIFAFVVLGVLVRYQERIPYQYIAQWIQRKAVTVQIGAETVRSEVSLSDVELARGLSERSFLPEGFGMLFDLGASQSISFWMQGMKINLDFIWINNDRVVGIDRNVKAPADGDDPEIRQSPGEVTYVLEVKTGWLEGIEEGDIVIIEK